MRFNDEIEAMHEEAIAARGSQDFGADDYREALAVLCESLDADASLTPIGEFALRGMIVDALAARLDCEAGWAAHPEAEQHAVEAPIVIIGLPRTGTTALHHLMAQAPDVQALEHWLMRTPKPRPPLSRLRDDADFLAAEARVAMIFERSPDMKAIHEIEADLPDECWNLFAQQFIHSSYQANADVGRYAKWWADQDLTPVYRRHLRNVQLIGHREPEKRWLFKDATHLFDLDALLAVYPDARIVQTHRDPVSLIPSVCSLCWSARSALNDGTDPIAFGASTLDLWRRGIEDMMAARARHPETPVYDLAFDRFVADPVAVIAEIHDAFDLPLSQDTAASMRAFREARPKGRHGEHRYALGDWGLDADAIRERFSEYTRTYDVREETAA